MRRRRLFRPVLLGALIGATWLAPGNAQAWELELDAALEGGAAFHYERTSYTPTDDPSLRVSVDHDSAWTPTGALQLSLMGRVEGALGIGAIVRGGISGGAFFGGELGTLSLGLLLGLVSDEPDGDAYGWLWVGPAVDFVYGLGFAAGVGAGYRWVLSDTLALGVGGAITTQWGFSGEAGDFGIYDYQHASVTPTLEVRLVYGLVSGAPSP